MRISHLRLAAAAALLAGVVAVPATHAATPAVAVAAPCGGPLSGGVPVSFWSHDLGTGEDHGVPHAFTTADPDWTVQPGGGPAYSVAPNSAWTTISGANWINDSPTRTSNGVTPTTFRTYFTIPSPSYARTISLTFAADNGVEFFLNGSQPVNNIGGYGSPVPPMPPTASFTQPHTLLYSGPALQDGLNYLDAVVRDDGVDKGLVVSGSASACIPAVDVKPGTCIEVRPDGLGFYWYSPAPYDLGTGESGYTPFPATTVDDDWTTAAPVAGPAYAVATYPSWVASNTSSWINSAPTADRALYGTRTYQVQFPLNPGATNTLLEIWFAVDNEVEFFLNGLTAAHSIGGYQQGPTQQAFNQKHHLTWAGLGFVTGTNTLYAVVKDYGVATGLLVEGGVRTCEKRRG